MAPKYARPALLGAVLMIGSAAMAAGYRPDDFLSLDLSKAVLSPNPLGPPTQFAPVAVQATDGSSSETAWARDDLKAAPRAVAVQRVDAQATEAEKADVRRADLAPAHFGPAHKVMRVRAETPRGPARTRFAHRHGSPLDAQAFDTRIQSWPCRSGGGICSWKQ